MSSIPLSRVQSSSTRDYDALQRTNTSPVSFDEPATRIASLVRNARIKSKSTVQTAIGVKHPKIQQKSQGFMGGSFNTREFFHHMSATFLRGMKWIFLLGAFAIPALLLLIALVTRVDPVNVLIAAFVIQYLGLVAERWFFFAQANHPQNIYYQSVA